jgi:hypothetical protein
MPKTAEFRHIEINPDVDLLTVQELAFCLRVADSYVYAMRRKGFPMPAGKATLAEARAWIVATNFKK